MVISCDIKEISVTPCDPPTITAKPSHRPPGAPQRRAGWRRAAARGRRRWRRRAPLRAGWRWRSSHPRWPPERKWMKMDQMDTEIGWDWMNWNDIGEWMWLWFTCWIIRMLIVCELLSKYWICLVHVHSQKYRPYQLTFRRKSKRCVGMHAANCTVAKRSSWSSQTSQRYPLVAECIIKRIHKITHNYTSIKTLDYTNNGDFVGL